MAGYGSFATPSAVSKPAMSAMPPLRTKKGRPEPVVRRKSYSGRQRNLPVYFVARIFAFNAVATRLTGGRPISPLTTLVAATSFSISTPVATPMPSSM